MRVAATRTWSWPAAQRSGESGHGNGHFEEAVARRLLTRPPSAFTALPIANPTIRLESTALADHTVANETRPVNPDRHRT